MKYLLLLPLLCCLGCAATYETPREYINKADFSDVIGQKIVFVEVDDQVGLTIGLENGRRLHLKSLSGTMVRERPRTIPGVVAPTTPEKSE